MLTILFDNDFSANGHMKTAVSFNETAVSRIHSVYCIQSGQRILVLVSNVGISTGLPGCDLN